MKKILLVFIVAFTIVAISSCAREDSKTEVISNETEQAYEMLKSELVNLNVATFGENPDTRGKWWRRLFAIVADAGVGLLTSNVGYGISASALAWSLAKVEAMPDNPNMTNHVVSIHGEDTCMQGVVADAWCIYDTDADGLIHNTVIVNLYNKYGEKMFDMPEADLLAEIAKEVSLLTEATAEDVFPDIDEAVAELKGYTEAYIEADTVDEYMNALKAYQPDKSEQFDVLQITLEGFECIDIETDDGAYVNCIMSIIEDSAINETAKKELKSAVAIANASVRLWDTSVLE